MRKTPFLSVIIPAYNAWDTIPKLLASLRKSRFKDFEVIVGDDGSDEKLTVDSLQLRKRRKKTSFTVHYPLSIVHLRRNRGPAAARNAAAKKAKGRVLVFLDSDVEVYPDTLLRIAKRFKKDPDLTTLTGVWDKHQRTSSFFPQFKALRDWSYWTNERDRNGYYYLFSTRIAAIKTDVFRRLKGFNESFRQMEDVELTYRIVRRYAIIFDDSVRVHHEFEEFLPVAKKYFWRSFYWTRLWGARKKFDPVATTWWETMAALTGVVTVLSFLFFITLSIFSSQFSVLSSQFSVLLFLIHVFIIRKFLLFVYREKGMVFAMKSLLTGLALYCVIITGSVWYQMRRSK